VDGRESFIFEIFKSFYLSNHNSNLRSVFTNKSISTRSLKLYVLKTFFQDESYQPSMHELSMVNVRKVTNPEIPFYLNFLVTFLADELATRYLMFW
jgi:hypothetical protein